MVSGKPNLAASGSAMDPAASSYAAAEGEGGKDRGQERMDSTNHDLELPRQQQWTEHRRDHLQRQ